MRHADSDAAQVGLFDSQQLVSPSNRCNARADERHSQTVRRPPAFYNHLLDYERAAPSGTSNQIVIQSDEPLQSFDMTQVGSLLSPSRTGCPDRLSGAD